VAATPGEPAPTWAVQVGVFKGRQQAETAHRKLVEGGLQASVTPAMVDGETRYRVRAGSYRTRAEAERVAERVRHDRALPTYITLN
jgi:cell division protein FtsN